MSLANADKRGAGDVGTGSASAAAAVVSARASGGWHSHFGLTSDPFRQESGEFYYGARFGVASLRLEQALEQRRGFIILTGPAGTGKSALLRSVLGRTEATATATVSAAHHRPSAVIDALLRHHEPRGEDSEERRRAALMQLIDNARVSGRPIVCVIEDAHLAKPGKLADLVAAVGVTPEAHKVLQIVLVGREELTRTLESPALADLRGRITARVQTVPFSAREVADFLTDRLELAGAPGSDKLMPIPTVAAIARYSQGIIALCLALAGAAMQRAAETSSAAVGPEHVDEAAAIYVKQPLGGRGKMQLREMSSWLRPGSAVGILLLALGVAGAQVSMIGTGEPPVEAAMGGISALPDTPTVAEQVELAEQARLEMLAQRRSPREEFLGGTPYEVEIKPPPRPGSTPAPQSVEQMIEESKLPPAPGPPRAPATKYPATAPMNRPPAGITPAPPPAPLPASEPASAAPVAQSPRVMGNVAPPGAGPYMSLQVGAFRDLRSATAMKKKLDRSFSEVYISDTRSGGEPLYRVRVGRFQTPEETLPLKQRLQAAGHPSFRVNEP